jgi:cytochrome c
MLRTSLTIALAAALLAGCGQKQEAASSQDETAAPSPPASATSAAPEASSAEPAAEAPALSAQDKALVATLPAPYNTGDVEHGKIVFARCQVCHTVTKGDPDMIGPNLSGIFGRKVASKPGYTYSDALKSKAWTWDAQHIDTWITDPRQVAPGTKMSFIGLADPKDRIDLIAYLKTATSK